MTVLVVAECASDAVQTSTLISVNAAASVSDDIHLLKVGSELAAIAKELQKIAGVKQVLLADNAVYQHGLAEAVAPLIASIATAYSHIIFPATSFGKSVAPRLAALIDSGQVSDVVEICNNDTFKRYIYAGNALATVKSLDEHKVLTVRTTAFSPAVFDDNHQADIKPIDYVVDNKSAEFVSAKLEQSERPSLTDADIVISGGRGLQDNTTFDELVAIADKMHAAIGASRAAVDAGLAPNDWQVGQTGQIVAPKLYIAVGISGAIQHLAGIKDSKVIVAINKDPEAPIFAVADYGLVADLKQILPEWQAYLAE